MLIIETSQWWLVAVSFITSMLTAVFGGGVLLISLMPGLLPADYLIT